MIWTLLILVMGERLWIVGERRDAASIREVGQFVETLCQAVADRRSTTAALGSTSRLIVEPLVLEMAERLAGRAPGDWTIDVVTGDTSSFADGTASHTATIVTERHPSLGLRVDHDPARGTFEILGYWEDA